MPLLPQTIDHERLTSLWSLLDHYAQTSPMRVAMKFEGIETCYSDLRDAALVAAADLSQAGFGQGDRIGYLGKNSDSYFTLLFAVARIGAVLTPLNWRLASEELAFIVADSKMKRIYGDPDFLLIARVLGTEANIDAVGLADGLPDLESIGSTAISTDLPSAEDIVFQVYTSGTTGRPKGVMLTNANLLALRAPGYRAGLLWFPAPGSTLCVALPVAHIAGTAYALFGFYAGARIVIMREFNVDAVLKEIAAEGVNHILLAPAAMRLLIESPCAAATDFSSLQYITYGAAPINGALLQEAMAVFGCGFVQMYGMTEAAGGVVALRPEDHVSNVPERLLSAGTAMPAVDVAVAAEDWSLLPPETIGELVIRSPSVMAGYWGCPEATGDVMGPDGWLKTGDIGRMDEHGFVFVLDRAKDMIISGGENIYPAEVENAIFGHPDVADVAVVGRPSAKWGEDVVAVVVPRGTAEPSLDSIIRWLDGKLARFKMPRHILLVNQLPRNAGNKVMRRVLRDPLWEGHARKIN